MRLRIVALLLGIGVALPILLYLRTEKKRCHVIVEADVSGGTGGGTLSGHVPNEQEVRTARALASQLYDALVAVKRTEHLDVEYRIRVVDSTADAAYRDGDVTVSVAIGSARGEGTIFSSVICTTCGGLEVGQVSTNGNQSLVSRGEKAEPLTVEDVLVTVRKWRTETGN